MAKRPFRSFGAAEILYAGDEIDEGKILSRTPSKLYDVKVPVYISLYSKELFTPPSTQRNAIDKSIRVFSTSFVKSSNGITSANLSGFRAGRNLLTMERNV